MTGFFEIKPQRPIKVGSNEWSLVGVQGHGLVWHAFAHHVCKAGRVGAFSLV